MRGGFKSLIVVIYEAGVGANMAATYYVNHLIKSDNDRMYFLLVQWKKIGWNVRGAVFQLRTLVCDPWAC